MWTADNTILPSGVAVPDAAVALAVALGCGLLVGIERERRRGEGNQQSLAGLRTFALACLMGAVSMLTGEPSLVAVGALMLAALGVVSHVRERDQYTGVTTEIALFVTFLIGVMSVWSPALAAAMAVAVTALLAARERLHLFVSHWLHPGEVRDGIFLGALVLIALPLMPNRPLWGEVLNPYLIVQLLALLLAIQSVAHLGRRLLDARRAVALSSVASGFVSSTATIASMGMAVREGHSGARLMAGAGLLSCVATFLQSLMIALAIQPAWFSVVALPSIAGSLVALGWGLWLVRGAPVESGSDALAAGGHSVPSGDGPPMGAAGAATHARPNDKMFSLPGALMIAALLTGVQALVYGLKLWLGQAGALAGTLVASLVDLHASLAAIMAMGLPDDSNVGLTAIMLAVGVHGLAKTATAGLSGGLRYMGWLAPGLLVHTGVCIAGLAWYL
jgi:uncharacterized membrane protein (DUF4010 family)